MENLKETLDESRPPAHIHLSRTGEVVKEEEIKPKSTLQPPPIDNYGIGTLTHNAMMKVYKGAVPNIAKWPSCLFHAEKMVWVDINWADKDLLWGILNECDSVLVSETSPSVKTFAHYLKGVVVDYLPDNDHPDLPEIPDSVPPSIKYMMKEALKGYIPGLQEDWTILPLDEIKFVHICNLDAVGLSSLKVECVNLTICADCAKTDSSLISYATFLLEILKFDHEHPHYFYNLESD